MSCPLVGEPSTGLWYHWQGTHVDVDWIDWSVFATCVCFLELWGYTTCKFESFTVACGQQDSCVNCPGVYNRNAMEKLHNQESSVIKPLNKPGSFYNCIATQHQQLACTSAGSGKTLGTSFVAKGPTWNSEQHGWLGQIIPLLLQPPSTTNVCHHLPTLIIN